MPEETVISTVANEGFSVSSNSETEDQIRENLKSDEKPKDGEPPDPKKEEEERVSKAGAELGKKGGEAAAKKRASEAKEKDEKETKAKAKEGEEGKDEKPVGKPRDDPRARMQEATRKESEAKRQLIAEREERARVERRLAEVERRTSTPDERRQAEKQGDESRPPEPPDKPKPEDFEDFDKYLDARDDWNRRQWRAQAAARDQAMVLQERLSSHVGAFKKQIDEAAAAAPGLHERISEQVGDLQPTFTLPRNVAPSAANWIADELVLSPESAVAVMLHFSENPEDLERIASLRTHREVTRAMAALATKLEPAETDVERKVEVSKAKPPVKSVAGSAQAPDADDVSDDEPFEAHVRKMNAKDVKARRGRS